MEGIVGTSPAAPADRLGGAAGRFLDAFAKDRGRRADPRLDDLRGRRDAGAARRDRALRRHAQGRGQEAVRHGPGEDGARADVVRRQRRPEVGGRGAVPGDAGQVALHRLADLRVEGQARQGRRRRRRRWPRPRRRTRRATSTTRRTCQGRALHGREHPRDAALGGGVQAQPVHRLAEDDRRRVLEPLGLAEGRRRRRHLLDVRLLDGRHAALGAPLARDVPRHRDAAPQPAGVSRTRSRPTRCRR